MILHFNTLKHPLGHAGTQQRDRMPASLVEGSLSADDRSMEQLIAFAGLLATHIRFFDEGNKAAGDWQAFWKSDATSLLAMIAATDPDSPRTGYRTAELEYYRRKKKEDEQGHADPDSNDSSAAIVRELVANTDHGVYALASLLLQICHLIPETHPLKKEIASIFSGLKDALRSLIQYHKSIDPQAIKRYAGFIGGDGCALPWGMSNNAAFECIDWVLPYEHVTDLWKLFLQFYQALMIIIAKAKKAFQTALRTRKDHQPHIGLYITFLYLFRYLQDDLNGLIDRHLLYYYQDVLRLARKALTPDKAYLYFQIANGLTRYRLPQGTAFKAGADSAGRPLQYDLMDELILSGATLVEKQNLYVEQKTAADGTKKVNAIFLPAADKRDGLKEEWPVGTKAWQALSGMEVFNRQYYKYRSLVKLVERNARSGDGERGPVPLSLRKEIEKYQQYLGKLKAFSGFSISSTEFWLDKGFQRVVLLNFEFEGAAPASSLLDVYDVDVITEKGLIPLQIHPLEVPADVASDEFLPEDATSLLRLVDGFGFSKVARGIAAPPDPSYRDYNRIFRIANSQRYLIFLGPLFPAILPVDDQTPPFVRFRSRDSFDPGLPPLASVDVKTWSSGLIPPVTGDPVQLQRVINGGVQSDTQLVIDGNAGAAHIFVRLPELFFKWPAMLAFDLEGDTDRLSVNQVSYWSGGQAVARDGNKVITLPNAKEKPGPLVAPLQIDASQPLQADGWVEMDLTVTAPVAGKPVTSFVFSVQDLQIEYKTMPVSIPVNPGGKRLSQYHYISQFNSLGEWIDGDSETGIGPSPVIDEPVLQPVFGAGMFVKEKKPAIVGVLPGGDGGMVPAPPAAPPAVPAADAPDGTAAADRNYGNLFLGFDKLTPGQSLSLLFQMAEGTGNPDHYAPVIKWSYLVHDHWVTIPPQYILKDTSYGLGQTGMIVFQVPQDINNGNTRVVGQDGRTDLYWLRASAEEIPDDQVFIDALPLLVDIFVNAGEVIFENDRNTEEHLEAGIPAGTIAAMKFRDVNVQTVTQPFDSFDGRESEADDIGGYVRRVHERLRHKDRAVTLWDYERLLLQAFPTIYVTKCLTHSMTIFTARPGWVTMAVIPDPGRMTGTRKYYPVFDAGQLAGMKEFLSRRSDYFVSNAGGPEFCCCEDGCECENSDRLTIINARFEPIRLKVCVRFFAGKDPVYYSKQLNEDIKAFLCPWSAGDKPLSFGTRITLTSILQFLEGLDYVDVILRLKVKHFATRHLSEDYEDIVCWESPDEIVPYTAASVLTTYLDRLNEDNPNVIDHEIEVATGSDRCHCGSCPECECESKKAGNDANDPVQPDPNKVTVEGLRQLLIDMWAQRSDSNEVIRLFTGQLKQHFVDLKLDGAIPVTPDRGKQGRDAYRVDKTKFANKISQLKVSLSFDKTKPFTVFSVFNPHLG